MRMPTLATLAALAAAGALAGGCGTAASHDAASASRTDRASTSPSVAASARIEDEPIATIGGARITRGMLAHWTGIASRSRGLPHMPPEEAALSWLIRARWLIGEASEEGVRIDQQRLKLETALDGPRAEEVRQTLESTQETPSDLKFARLVGQLPELIYRRLDHRVPTATRTQIAAYFERHRAHFALPERRDLNIVRLTSEAEARRVRREIEGGTSFATIVQRSTAQQPVSAHAGLLRGLSPTNWPEPRLSDAVFRAPLRTLHGPIRISFGYFVFEVTRRIPGAPRTLAEVEPEVAQALQQRLRERVVTRFARSLGKKWGARTSCQPGPAVAYCKRYRSAPGNPLEGASLL